MLGPGQGAWEEFPIRGLTTEIIAGITSVVSVFQLQFELSYTDPIKTQGATRITMEYDPRRGDFAFRSTSVT
jgi:hypothetical protein